MDQLSDKGVEGMVKLHEHNKVDWQAGPAIIQHWVERQPGQGVVVLKNVAEERIKTNKNMFTSYFYTAEVKIFQIWICV